MNKFVTAIGAVALSLVLGTAHAAPIRTDIVFVVDESGSMGGVQANLRNNIGQFASILSAGNVDATYALVGYGNAAVVPRILTNFTNPTAFATAAQGLQISGGTEPGYSAITFALNGLDNQSATLNFRANSLKNIILLTDEPSNGDQCNFFPNLCRNGLSLTRPATDAVLKANQALLNVVTSSTFGATADFQPLATANGGQNFDLNQFGSSSPTVVQQFVTSFANAKLQEIIDTCQTNPNLPGCQPTGVPEPASMALLVTGLIGLGAAARRRRATA